MIWMGRVSRVTGSPGRSNIGLQPTAAGVMLNRRG
jgi:hypothetical protein